MDFRSGDAGGGRRGMSKYRVVRILTDDDGYVLGHGRLISAKADEWGRKPLFDLKHQDFVPLSDVEAILGKQEARDE